MNPVPVVQNVAALQAALSRQRAGRVALVPTMGALHEGHLALVREARARVRHVVVSVFVNPAQFAPHEDFARYPRDLASDQAKLAATEAVDLIFAPATEEMYPNGFATKIVVDGPAFGLESDFRPHFFAGVATVVAKLFLQVQPDIAVFGEKDYQQLLVVKRLVRDLDIATEIVPVPTVRERDGLALSSRNAYLSKKEREIAPTLHRALNAAGTRAQSGVSIPKVEAEGAAALLNAGFDRVDYFAIRDAETLQPVKNLARPSRALAAAWLGKTRLIDNAPLEEGGVPA
jgi:pantoate--beta-alanine ligase